jgi:hypothetical protein
MSIMAVRRGIAAILLASFLRIAAASHLGPQPVLQPSKFHIRLVDLAGLPQKIRTEAQTIVVAVFRKAGFEIDFVDCLGAKESPCREEPARTDLWLQILKQRPVNLHGDTTGFAVLVPSDRPSDSYAVVSFPKVEAAAHDLEVPVAEVLAAAMAHEIGHLLLHSPAHSHCGIMSPRMDRRQIRLLERGELLFTKE